MKIIHCADIHLDSKLRTNLTNEQARERRRELLMTFEKMVVYAKKQKVDAIIIAGDLFDTGNVSATAKKVVASCIADNVAIEFYYLKGNHDADNFLSAWEELPKNLHLFSEKWKTYDFQGITISGVELSKENTHIIYEELVLDPKNINLVMLHGQEVNCQGNDKAEVIQIPSLVGKFIDYLALGHIHSYKKQELDFRGTYCYSGCLEGRGYDESGEKGFVLLTIENKKIETIFVPFGQRTIHEVEVDITGLTGTIQIAKKMEEKLSNIPPKDMVKIILKGKVAITAERDLLLLETKFKGLYYTFKIDDSLVRLQLNPKDYEKDASLKGEFIRLIMSKELGDEKESSILELGLKVLAGEDVD